MAFFNEFPHTRTYDSDLGWIIVKIKELLVKWGNLEKAWEEFQKNFDSELDQTVKDQLTEWLNDGTLASIISQLISELPYINIKDYGAVGNGIKDDSDAIQAAIKYAESVGCGCIFFPRGRYLISNGFTCTVSIRLLGEGIGESLIIANSSNFSWFKFTRNVTYVNISQLSFMDGEIPGTQSTMLDFDCSNITIADCRFERGYDIIKINAAQNVVIDSCLFWTFLNSAILTTGNCNDFFISKCFINGDRFNGLKTDNYGIRCDGNQNALVVESCELILMSHAVIGSSIRYSFFANSFFDSCVESSMTLTTCSQIGITNCWFSSRCTYTISLNNCEQVRFTGCTFYFNNSLFLIQNCSNIVISSNSFSDCKTIFTLIDNSYINMLNNSFDDTDSPTTPTTTFANIGGTNNYYIIKNNICSIRGLNILPTAGDTVIVADNFFAT